MALNGPDISSYQGGLNLNNISYDFVLIKATEGNGYVNPYCDTHFQEALAAGKKIALYHFFDFSVDAAVQADFFVDNTLGYIHKAIFALDWEGAGVGDVGAALRFLQRVEQRIGYKPAIYMSEYVENNYDWTAVVNNDYGLWAAKYADYEIDNNYDTSNAGQSPNVTHWPFYFMWQWTSAGRLNGYAGNLDCDIFYGDVNTWDAYAGKIVQPAPAAPAPAPVVETPVPIVTPTVPEEVVKVPDVPVTPTVPYSPTTPGEAIPTPAPAVVPAQVLPKTSKFAAVKEWARGSLEGILIANSPRSKAIAGSLAAIVAGLGSKFLGNLYTPELNAYVSVAMVAVVTALFGYLVVYFAPKNKNKGE